MKTNYLLIDFENVQPKTLALLKGHHFKVILFVGSNQTKVPLELAKELQSLGKDAEYVQISGSGRNALDFHIAFALGELTTQDPTAHYHIISRDTGFDPLVKYSKEKGFHVFRSKDVADLPLLRVSSGKAPADKIEAVVSNLRSRGSGRPRKIRTLKNTISSLFLKSLPDDELAEIISALARHGYITIAGEDVSYHLHGAEQRDGVVSGLNERSKDPSLA